MALFDSTFTPYFPFREHITTEPVSVVKIQSYFGFATGGIVMEPVTFIVFDVSQHFLGGPSTAVGHYNQATFEGTSLSYKIALIALTLAYFRGAWRPGRLTSAPLLPCAHSKNLLKETETLKYKPIPFLNWLVFTSREAGLSNSGAPTLQ